MFVRIEQPLLDHLDDHLVRRVHQARPRPDTAQARLTDGTIRAGARRPSPARG
ncbi:hypothetical protein G3M58_93060 [Streptomyces sp. SID7499]|uniref:Uncharacterized protein n=1 Tax=Streptomyces sp. SID7499 TaxID=2706086 RepID=A0A6G3XYR4_9ACTN|nr:hypothetical protein [Streptomyces sp. SID7499]